MWRTVSEAPEWLEAIIQTVFVPMSALLVVSVALSALLLSLSATDSRSSFELGRTVADAAT